MFKSMQFMLSFVGKLSLYMIPACILGTLGFVLSMSVPFIGLLGMVKLMGYDVGLSYQTLIFAVICSGCLRGGLRYFEQYLNHLIAFLILARLRDEIFKTLRRLCPAKLETKEKGSLIALMSGDIETLEVFYAHTISPVCIAIMTVIFVSILLYQITNFIFVIYVLVIYAILGIVLPYFQFKKMNEIGRNYRQQLGQFNALLHDRLMGIKELCLYGKEFSTIATLLEKQKQLTKDHLYLNSVKSNFNGLIEIFIPLACFLALALGIKLGLNEARLILGVSLFFGSFGPCLALANLPQNLNQSFASSKRLESLLKEKEVVSKVEKGMDFECDMLEVKHLNFQYAKRTILKDFNLTVNKGELVGIKGPSGCGKSTLLKLLLRFWPQNSGQILYNQIPIENIQTDKLYKRVSLVSQETFMFNKSIKENLLLANNHATEEQLKEALKNASCQDLMEYLDRPANELSAGQKQRLGLAQAFLRNSDIILLDEPTSHIDSLNEKIILNCLEKMKGQKTMIIVSHRLSTLAMCDRVIDLEKGEG